MMNPMRLLGLNGAATVFRLDEQRAWLDRLCGVPCASAAAGAGPLASGLTELATSIGRFEGDDLTVTEATSDGHNARIVWQAGGGALQWESTWSVCRHTVS